MQVNYTASDEIVLTASANPGQTLSHLEVTVNGEYVIQVNSSSQNFSGWNPHPIKHNYEVVFLAPAAPLKYANTVSVQAVDMCGQKSTMVKLEMVPVVGTGIIVKAWACGI